MGVTIRAARHEDIPGVAALAGNLVRYHHALDSQRFMLPPNVEQGYLHYLHGELRSGDVVMLVAVDDAARVLGYTYARVEPRDWNALLDRCGAIHDIFVADNARRQGLARRLMEETVRQLEELGVPRIVLHTAVQNQEAQQLFASLGFRTTMLEMTRENARPPRRSVPPTR